MPLVVSYFTPEYAAAAKTLVQSLKKFELDYEVVPQPDLGSWQKNSQYKPRFLWSMAERHKGRPLLWIDADAKVVGDVSCLAQTVRDCDVAAVEYRWKKVDRQELLSGTLLFSGTEASYRVLDKWIEVCDEDPNIWDQRALRKAFNEFEGRAKLLMLPLSFAYIFDTHAEQFPEVVPLIVHYQWSRKMRAKGKA